MGTLPIDDLSRTDSAGVRWRFESWTTTSDLSDPERGAATISISSDGENEPSYVVWVCMADYSDRWLRRFTHAFVAHPDFREQFLDRTGSRAHPTIRCNLPGGPADIDEAIAAAITALNGVGAVTSNCCQGGGGSIAYASLSSGSFPAGLVSAWEGAGFDVSPRSVYASAPFGMEDQASERWVQSLQDWVDGRLDETGVRYRMSGKRPSSLPKLPPEPAGADPTTRNDVKRLIRMGPKAKFRDFAQLRSGRDSYSSMRLSELESAVDPGVLPSLADLDEVTRAKALRWVLRGLPADMAAHKVKVDAEVSENASGSRRRR